MADKPVSMRCSHCGINYPSDKKVCLVVHCKQPTWKAVDEQHDTDWKAMVDQLNKYVHRDGIDKIPDISVELTEMDGQLFVADHLIAQFGYLWSNSGDILKLNGDYYEIYGAVHPNSEAAGWWIRVIPIEGVFDGITPEDIITPPSEAES